MARRDFGLHKVGKYWHADFWVGQVHIHRSTRHTVYDDARDLAETWHTEQVRKANGQKVNSNISVVELWELWLEWAKVNHSEKHWKRAQTDWVHHILPHIGDRKAKSITDADVEDLRTRFLGGTSLHNSFHGKCTNDKKREAEGANKVMRHLRLVFRWGVNAGGKLAEVPFKVRITKGVEKPKSALAGTQVDAFLRGVDRGRSLHLKVMVRLMLFLGLREKEARELRWNHFESPELRMVWPVGKGDKARPLPVLPQLREWLLKVWPDGATELPDTLVLPSANGKPHVAEYTRHAVARGAKAAGMGGKLTPHRMRGSFGTLLVREGKAEAHLVQKGLRHDKVTTSEHYVHLDTSDLESAMTLAFGKPSLKSHKITRKFFTKLIIK